MGRQSRKKAAQRLARSATPASANRTNVAAPLKAVVPHKEPLERSTLESYAGIILGFVLWRLPMSAGLQGFVLVVIAGMATDCAWNSRWTLNYPWKLKLAVSVIAIVAVCAVFPILPKSPTSDVVISSLKQLNEFIGGREEPDLDDLFGFPDMIRINMAYAKQCLAPSLLTNDEKNILSTEMATRPWGAMADLRYGKFYTVNHGGLHADDLPGKIKMVYFSQNYLKGRALLANYRLSAEIPPNVVSRVKDLDDTVENDAKVLLDVINKEAAANPSNLIYETDTNSPFWGVTSSEYWKEFVPLKPKADAVILAIRPYLGTD